MNKYFFFCGDCRLWVQGNFRWANQRVEQLRNGTYPYGRSGLIVEESNGGDGLSEEQHRDLWHLIKDSRSKAEKLLLMEGFAQLVVPPFFAVIKGKECSCIHELRHRFRHLCCTSEWLDKDKRELMSLLVRAEVNDALNHDIKTGT